MSDPDDTTELQAVGDGLPALTVDLRDHLPGYEPDRQVTDWGRSERVEGLVDRTLLDFLYRYWFRVEVEGIDNVPQEAGALVVGNHAGGVPCDAAMIAKALREELPRSRPIHVSTDGSFSSVPGVGMMLAKLGAVADHPANLHRLLFDEQELVLAFPEGREAVRKSFGRRYMLRRFSPDFILAAARARVAIVPVALVGSEEAAPVFPRLTLHPLLRTLMSRAPRLPLSAPLPLPAKFRLRFLEPVELQSAELDSAAAGALAADVRALIQENLLEMIGQRRSVWLG
ncbi:MAG: 1-acyl-sn-glycerol-3-phosphate acyltransferase [Actinomycetota bacterium]|nr:1-acyl-sn-glycerol-3-phosphate acyltransferase [Actinomycetota bacterium]